ncbi:hypothetical protein D3OALGA1CA_4433 [Olavius algarvensis associated proteobacterium Delta 3]|nr:hypothetical protein D3OALGB2SA_3683 [Olavius algarvensis associated proteobacterium Delta 3]CAB5151209.1 hypothetical protein D3OALGA1CA_4433 [Olavius algarvensis associated proteobacterium Delta 3]
MKLQTCVAPTGEFVIGKHEPSFTVDNFRETDTILSLGELAGGQPVMNTVNFPNGAVEVTGADGVIEVANPFPFRGATYILQKSADRCASDPTRISLPTPAGTSFHGFIRHLLAEKEISDERLDQIFRDLPASIKIALATTSTDPEDLIRLAHSCGKFVCDSGSGQPVGLRFKERRHGVMNPATEDHFLFETIANNWYLPNVYKEVMVLRPGVQGGSEIVGEWRDPDSDSHVFEYLRRNSYIPWGHYAANMAHDAIRYRTEDLTLNDMFGMRHLYYQRTFVRMAKALNLHVPTSPGGLSVQDMEILREASLNTMISGIPIPFASTLWGWNFGFDYAPSRYRLHASHQQIHQQYALVPDTVRSEISPAGSMPSYGCAGLIGEFIDRYRDDMGVSFFPAYLDAIKRNRRMDGATDRPQSLVVFQDERVMVFVPKAQTSQWELQVMPLVPVGHILEADTDMRRSLDRAIYAAIQVLSRLGARMVTVLEYPKRFDRFDSDQHLLYAFLPRMPESPGAFSEAQLRWVNGHYPEDFAAVCRDKLASVPDIS